MAPQTEEQKELETGNEKNNRRNEERRRSKQKPGGKGALTKRSVLPLLPEYGSHNN